MKGSSRHIANVALTGLLAASLLGCSAAPSTNPGGATSAPGGTTLPPAGSVPAGSASGVASIGVQEAVAAAGLSTPALVPAEIALAEAVASAAGLPAGLGLEHWTWARQFLLDEAAKGAQNLVITGESGRVASLDQAPPRLDVATAEGGGAAAMGLMMAGSMISSALQGSSNPSANGSGSVSGTQTTTANGETTTGTVTFNMSTTTAGSTIEGDVTIGIDMTVTDAASGAALRTGHFSSQGKIRLDFCPDANGKVHGHVSMTIQAGQSGGGAAEIVVEADVVGTVGDDAYLNEVEITGQSTQNTTTAGSSTQRTVTTNMRYRAGINRSGVITPNQNSATGQGTGPGDLSDAEVNQGYRQITTAAASAIWVMGDAAQAKWRNGACVEIRSTEQSRDVQKNEVVQFESKVFHKIDGVELHKNIVNRFTGKQSIDPVGIPVPAPVTNSFKAGPMVDDTGTIEMTTTSNRGIGMLTITFRVKGGWIIDEASGGGRVHGQKCGDPPGPWTIDGTYSRAGFVGEQRWSITIAADARTGTFTYNTTQEGKPAGAPVTIYLVGRAQGTVTLAIDAVDGTAHMVLKETKHTYSATTSAGGTGSDQNAPLEQYTFDWDVGGAC